MFEKKMRLLSLAKMIILLAIFIIFLMPLDIFAFDKKNNHILDNSTVVINEFMAKNESYITDQDGKYDDWIELYNNSAVPIDISGYYLSDKSDRPDKYQIPEGTIIEGHSYLIIWADEDGDQEGLHANFKLSADGEELRMFSPDLVMIQEVIFGIQEADMSYSRIPNGTGDFIIKEPTFNRNNESTNSIDINENLNKGIVIYPNPTDSQINIFTDFEISGELQIFYSNGELLRSMVFYGEATLNVGDYPPGMYFVRIGSVVNKFMINK